MKDGITKCIRCYNEDIHKRKDGEGNILAFFRKDSIFIKCSDRGCKRWTRIMVRIPGVEVDFSSSAFIQKLMPENYHFDSVNAQTVIDIE